MNSVGIETRDGQTHFVPGEPISGRCQWQLEKQAKAVEVRLFWYTEGKGDQDVGLVDTLRIDDPAQQGWSDFSFELPLGPYSFSGRLISLTWALEVLALGTDATQRLDLVVSPSGAEIDLHTSAEKFGAP